MKKNNTIFSILMLLLLVITSCKIDGEEFLAKELKLSANEVALEVGTQQEIEVLSGNGGYKAKLSNEVNVKVGFKGKKLFIEAIKEGEVIVTVIDEEGEESIVKVQVTSPKGLKLSVNELILVKGSQEKIKILDGNGGYKVKVVNDYIKAEIKDGEIHVDALKEGESTITITDVKGQEASVKVVISSLKEIKLGAYELNLEKGSKGEIKILDGNGNYKVTGSNSIVEAKLENEIISVKGLKEGVATITITDVKGQEASVKVVISSLKEIKLSAYELNLVKGSKGEIKILDGNGNYKVTGSNSIVEATLKNGIIHVKGLKDGTITIKITDEKGKTVSVKIVVTSPKEIKLSTYELNLVKGSKGEIKILDGNGNYKVTGSNSIVEATLKNGIIHVKGLKDGVTTIKIIDEKEKTVSVKVVVSSPKELKLSTSILNLEKGGKGEVKILVANGTYKITESNSKIKTELKSGVIYVTGLAGGTSIIKVTDEKGKTASVSVTVTLPKELKLSASKLTLEKGGKGEVKILDGNGGYKVASTSSVKAEFISGVLHLTALEGGVSTIKVTDVKGKTASVIVTVTLPKELKLSASKLTLEKGSKGEIKILDGNGGYKVTSTSSVKAEFISGVIYLTALEGGVSTIKVTDEKGKTASVSVTVTLPKELKLSASKLTLEKDSKGEIKILDGNGGYKVTSTSSVKAEFISGVIYLTALEGGVSTIKVTDEKGKTASVIVTVTLPKELKLSASKLTLEKGSKGEVKILVSNGNCKVEVSNSNIKAELKSGVIYVTGLAGGTSTIEISDAKGKTTSVNVTVTLPKEMKLSASKLTLEKGNKGEVKILVSNGNCKVEVSNSNIKAELKSGVIYVTGLAEGSSTIEISDAKGKTASVSVVVKKNNTDTVNTSLFNKIHRIEIITHEGHLHGSYLHGNAGNQTPRAVKQYFILEKNAQGSFVHLTKTGVKGYINPGESMVVLGKDSYGEKWTPRYAYEFIYYNKAGERLEGEFLKNKDMYQTLFSIEEYKVLATNEIKNVTTKEFMSYTYRDTNPSTKMFSSSSDIENNFLGFKGYGYVKEARISYTLKVNFVKCKSTGDKVNSIFLEDANQDKFEEKIQIDVPIVIPVGRSHNDQFKIMAAYFGMTVDEYDKLFWLSNPAESSKYYM